MRVPSRSVLWGLFGVCWTIDLFTAISFFAVSHVDEINPVTVFFYQQFGIPGVVLAASCYAVLVVAIVRSLPRPLDKPALVGVTVAYAAFATHNLSLLFWDRNLLAFYAVVLLLVLLSVAFAILFHGPDPLPTDRRDR